MRVSASVPVTAPSPPQWQAWWGGLVARLTREVAGGDGGPAWRPGARWDLTPARLTRGTVEASVRAAGRGRAVELSYREHTERRRQARMDVDGLEQPRVVTSSGTLAPVAWTGKAAMAEAGPVVRLDLTLPWGRLRLRARVAGDRLESELVVRGRGLWRPLAAVALGRLRTQVGVELERAAERAAAAVGRVARDPCAAAGPDGGPDEGSDVALGEVLDAAVADLSWLRSPVTILGHLRRPARDSP